MAKLYIFDHDGIRVVTDPSDIEVLHCFLNTVIDPDLSQVEGVPSKYWKLEGKSVVPMNDAERSIRDQIKPMVSVQSKKLLKYLGPAAAAASALAWYFLRG